jgi:hypothetical protein
MLRQEELAYVKAISVLENFPTFLRKMGKALAVGKKTKILVVTKAKILKISAFERKRRPRTRLKSPASICST